MKSSFRILKKKLKKLKIHSLANDFVTPVVWLLMHVTSSFGN
jgi:hypothetical protein